MSCKQRELKAGVNHSWKVKEVAKATLLRDGRHAGQSICIAILQRVSQWKMLS